MAEDLLPRMVRNNYPDYGTIWVRRVEQREEDLLVYLDIKLDEDPELPPLELVGEWIPITKHLNGAPSLSELIRGGFGMLAQGPEQLVLAYEEVLSSYGVSTSHHPCLPRYDENLSLLFFDESYVIAERFSAEPIR